MGSVAINMVGRRFGRLTVIERAETPPFTVNNHAWWHCKCDCGGEIAVSGASLRGGLTRSCGCLRRESARRATAARVAKAKARREAT